MIRVSIIPVLQDNYSYVLESDNGDVAIVDPGDSLPVVKYLEEKGLIPRIIFNTHHHDDHIAGNADITARYSADIAAPQSEHERIPGITIPLSAQSKLIFGGEEIRIIETPGHTRGHICLHFPASGLLFAGDTLFSMGCGRIFEGTPGQMWNSLLSLAGLPLETMVYCGHEYTESNGRFALHLDPDNPDLARRMDDVRNLRRRGEPSIPSTIGLEMKTNPFLRAQNAAEFATLRELKNRS